MPDQIQPTEHHARERASFWLAIAILVVSVGVVCATGYNSQVTRALTLATTKQPEPFTELFFNDHRNLPKHITAQIPATFSYHVSNHEAKTTDYTVRVTITEGNTSRILQIDHFTLPDGASKDVPVSFSTIKPGSQIELTVELVGFGQTINFRSQS